MINLPFLEQFINKKKRVFPPKDNFLTLDIGTEYLKSILFKMNELGVEIKKNSRIQQQQDAMNKGMILNLTTVLENCRLAINELTADLIEEELPKDLVMGVAGEYVQGVSIVVNYERDEDYNSKVDRKEQKKIINQVYKKIVETGKEDLGKRTGLSGEDIQILHVTVTGMEIGGMPVDSLVGFRGKDVKLHFHASFSPKTFVDSLKTLAESLDMNLLGVVSQPFAVARAFSGSTNKDFSGIFIDIGGGTTDLAIVNQGNVVDTQIFAFGGRVWTKELAKKMNLDYRHAESRKIKYSQGKLNPSLSGEVKSVMHRVTKLWLMSLQSALEMSEDVEKYPSQIYLCGGGSLLPEVRNFMLEFPWTKLLPFSSIPEIKVFKPDQLEGIIDESNCLRRTYDVTPAALCRFAYHKLKYPKNYLNNLK